MIVRGLTLPVLGLITVLTWLLQPETSLGQLIGNRTLGGPAASLTQQSAAANAPATNAGLGQASNALGSLGTTMQTSNKRFLRGNRSRQDFVGSNRSDLNRFVGSGQALGVGRVPSAVENLRIETTKTKINRPMPPQPAQGMYYPRLELDFEPSSSEGRPRSEAAVNPDLRERMAQFSSGSATVTMLGNTAIIRGTVDSTRTSQLLVQILSFEPGIDQVKNELVIK